MANNNSASGPLRVAVAKGRLFERITRILGQSSWVDPQRNFDDRALKFALSEKLEVFVVRAVDVPTYVARGVAQAGLCGSDTILEHGGEFLQLLDTGIGKCRLCLCGAKGRMHDTTVRTVATKFTRLAKSTLAQHQLAPEFVKLGGALELAPAVGLADAIVDLVETGRTLEANGLEPWLDLIEISTRLVTTESSLALHRTELVAFTDDLRASLEQESP